MNAAETPAARAYAFTFAGMSDEHDACECCGKTGLKRTVALRPVEGGDVVHYGTTCASLALMGRKLGKTQADNLAKSLNSERNNWRAEAERIAKHFAANGATDRAACLAGYLTSNRGIAPAKVWTNGARWFGWNVGNAAFNERMTELGWSLA